MRRLLSWAAALLFATMSATTVHADSADEQAVQSWLLYRCNTGDQTPAVSVQDIGAAGEAYLLEAATSGPSTEMRSLLEEQLVDQWQHREQRLRTGDDTGLDEDLIALLRSESKAAFMRRNLDEFTLAYRDKALKGLELVATELSRSALTRLVDDSDEVISLSASRALQAMEDRQAEAQK